MYGTWQVTHFSSPDTNGWFEWDYTAKDTMFIELRKNGTWYWNSNPTGTYELKENTLYTEISGLNDAIYYLSWVDYFVNLLLHNYFFPDTAYKLLGFFENDNIVYAVVILCFI